MKITLHQVADRAGVSIATVSRVLNGKAVAQPNRGRVERAVEELGFVLNQQARALKSDRTMTMGLILFDLSSPMKIGFIDTLGETLEARGYSLLISTARGDAERYDHLMRRFLERRVDGLFCSRPRGASASLALYRAGRTPAIALFSAEGAFAQIPLLEPSFSELAESIATQLKDLGHVRLAVLSYEHDAFARPVAAVADALCARGLDVQRLGAEADVARLALDLKARRTRPTAIVASSAFARPFRIACQVANLRLPEDLSLISIGEAAADLDAHDISSWVIEHEAMGRAAAEAMFGLLEGVRPQPSAKVITASYRARGTTGPAPGARRIRAAPLGSLAP